MKIISDLVKLDAPLYIFKDTLSWFCSALRENRNRVTHYMDDIKGEGTYLENKTRMHFFQILQQIVNKLKESNDKADIKYFLKDCLQWKFMGRDHNDLLQLGLFSVLHKGNGERDNLIRRSWGKNILLGKKIDFDHQSITKDLVEHFENLMTSIIARIVDPQEAESLPKKSKGGKQLALQKAKSVINEDVSETLLVQGFDIIFKEFNRYVKIMNYLFKGIDWATYAKSRTQDDQLQSLTNENTEKTTLMDEDSDIEDINELVRN